MNQLEQRIKILEGKCGLGELAARAEEMVNETSTTDAGLTLACGDRWEWQRGESDRALRKRALSDLLKENRSALMRKVMKHTAELMRATCDGTRWEATHGETPNTPDGLTA